MSSGIQRLVTGWAAYSVQRVLADHDTLRLFVGYNYAFCVSEHWSVALDGMLNTTSLYALFIARLSLFEHDHQSRLWVEERRARPSLRWKRLRRRSNTERLTAYAGHSHVCRYSIAE